MSSLAPVQQVRIDLGDRSYSIVIGEGLLPRIGEFALPKAHSALVVTNTTVAPLHGEALLCVIGRVVYDRAVCALLLHVFDPPRLPFSARRTWR